MAVNRKTQINQLNDLRRSRKPSAMGEIGSVWGTWEVIGEFYKPNDKRIFKKCRCIDCGAEKDMVKTVLIKQTPKCQECGSLSLFDTKKELIEQRYDKLLNKKPIESISSVSKNVWFKCEKGHTYKASVLTLDEKCPICDMLEHSEEILSQRKISYEKLYYYTKYMFEIFFPKEGFIVERIDDIQTLRVINKNLHIVLFPIEHKKYNILYHSDKYKFYDIQKKHQDLINLYIDKETREIETDLVFRYDCVKVSKLIVSLIEEYGYYTSEEEKETLLQNINERISFKK